VNENGKALIKIFDVYGNKISENNIEGIQNIDVSSYRKGYYIILIIRNNSNAYKKIIIY